jgi:2-hydroxy-6-oxonona-2,4-dienedioate hydrolase
VLSDSWTCVDGLRWHARVAAGGDRRETCPVVLVHGFGVSSAYFVPLAERLAPRFDVYAPDLPGHGRSQAPPESLDIVGLADALLQWLLARGLERVCMVGHSMGCQVAVELAARNPGLVDRLVLIGPTLDREARSLRRTLPRFAAGALRERPSRGLFSLGLLIVKDYARMAPRLPDELRAMFGHAIEASLPLATAPVLLVRGEQDRVVPQRWIEELAALAPECTVVVVPGAAHAVHYSHPDAVARKIEAFLAQGCGG